MCKWGISWELLALMLISATEVTRVLFLLHACVFKIWQEVLERCSDLGIWTERKSKLIQILQVSCLMQCFIPHDRIHWTQEPQTVCVAIMISQNSSHAEGYGCCQFYILIQASSPALQTPGVQFSLCRLGWHHWTAALERQYKLSLCNSKILQ